jgi:hypothetical protein
MGERAMVEICIGLVVLGVVAALFVLPVIAIVRTQRIVALAQRVEDRERQVDRLRRRAPAEVHEDPAPEAAPPSAVVESVRGADNGGGWPLQVRVAGGILPDQTTYSKGEKLLVPL